jgi:ribosome-binding protein aMBF1 (putative translation factor)
VRSKDRALLRLKEEFDSLLRKDIEIRRAHVENLDQLQELNLRISERLIQGLEAVKRRNLPEAKTALPTRARVAMPKGYESFGKRIKGLRKASNLTLEDVAKRIGSHKGYVSGIESGKVSPPSAKFVVKFARMYTVDEKELLRLALIEKAHPVLRDDLIRAFWPKAGPGSA